jgi:hypothetical protein
MVAAAITAVATLKNVTFGLVIADGFSRAASSIFTSTQAVLQESGVTPVALFSAHGLEKEQTQMAGFRPAVTSTPIGVDVTGHVDDAGQGFEGAEGCWAGGFTSTFGTLMLTLGESFCAGCCCAGGLTFTLVVPPLGPEN